ncbi:DUF814 domain containing protein [Niveomyces insectorum RCEF 264]|uniref:DUF814 domain containing protein n=1 Tax=Niveomyces insectorum RCEF 264 TaxID=1081102 RepID=A0A167VC62_9HYPO|nr:DUF814 domain containing protein [Niveomyces insectorum RCEF 264]
MLSSSGASTFHHGDSDNSYVGGGPRHQHQGPLGEAGMLSAPGVGAAHQDTRPAHVFSSYAGYPGGTPLPPMSSSVAMAHSSSMGGGGSAASTKKVVPQPDGLFPDLPEAKKRKFVLVEDRGSRLRVRVTLNMVDTSEIPDSFRRANAVYPGSYFPREMESPPPSPTGRRFFLNDLDDVDSIRLDGRGGAIDDDGDNGDDNVEVEAGTGPGSGRRGAGARRQQQHDRRRRAMAGGSDTLDDTTTMVTVPGSDGEETEVAVPRMRKALRRKQVRLNDLGCRMAWLQSRAFAGRRIFLQKALDTYRSKTCNGILASMQDVSGIAPHYELRVGKKKWLSCEREMELRQLSRT